MSYVDSAAGARRQTRSRNVDYSKRPHNMYEVDAIGLPYTRPYVGQAVQWASEHFMTLCIALYYYRVQTVAYIQSDPYAV